MPPHLLIPLPTPAPNHLFPPRRSGPGPGRAKPGTFSACTRSRRPFAGRHPPRAAHRPAIQGQRRPAAGHGLQRAGVWQHRQPARPRVAEHPAHTVITGVAAHAIHAWIRPDARCQAASPFPVVLGAPDGGGSLVCTQRRDRAAQRDVCLPVPPGNVCAGRPDHARGRRGHGGPGWAGERAFGKEGGRVGGSEGWVAWSPVDAFPHPVPVLSQSGSGKSTVIQMLLRLYDPDRGVVR